jgi:uncharacterized protein (TIGR04255 family)
LEEFEHLSRAPIQEAILDLRLSFRVAPEKSNFEPLKSALLDSYPKSTDIQQFQAEVNFDGGTGSLNHNTQFAGVRFESPNLGFVFQAQANGFTLSKLRPYTSWGDLKREAQRLWKIYFAILAPATIERIACRYVNKFEIPKRDFDFKEYFVMAPDLPSSLPQGVSRYLLQQEVPLPEARATVLLTQAVEGVTAAAVSFLLDIDAFKLLSLEASLDEWWLELDELAKWKNRFFFGSVTELAIKDFR